jgi:hypothetical protein
VRRVRRRLDESRDEVVEFVVFEGRVRSRQLAGSVRRVVRRVRRVRRRVRLGRKQG